MSYFNSFLNKDESKPDATVQPVKAEAADNGPSAQPQEPAPAMAAPVKVESEKKGKSKVRYYDARKSSQGIGGIDWNLKSIRASINRSVAAGKKKEIEKTIEVFNANRSLMSEADADRIEKNLNEMKATVESFDLFADPKASKEG